MLRRLLLGLAVCILASTSVALSAPPVVRPSVAGPNLVYLPLMRKDPLPPSAPPANAVTVRSSRTFIESNSRTVLGEVINTLPVTIYAVELQIDVYDANSQKIGSFTDFTAPAGIAPGEVAPFRSISGSATLPYARYEVKVVSYSTTNIFNYRPLTIVSQQVDDSSTGSGARVSGELRNDSGAVLIGSQVEVTFYDVAGNVIEVGRGPAERNRIEPGGTSAYFVYTYNEIAFDSYRVIGHGKVQ